MKEPKHYCRVKLTFESKSDIEAIEKIFINDSLKPWTINDWMDINRDVLFYRKMLEEE